jgi:hypothetical protein
MEVLWNIEDIVISLILSGKPRVYSQGPPHPLRGVRPWETLNYTSNNIPIHPGDSFQLKFLICSQKTLTGIQHGINIFQSI